MNELVETRWLGQMTFESAVNGHSITIDASSEHGGLDRGPRPKPLLLSALAGCTGMDIVSILKKKRVEFSAFTIHVDAVLTDTHPKYYNKIHLVFTLSGPNFSNNSDIMEKVRRAVELSSENYCGVSAMLEKMASITWEIVLKNDG